jgi:hypothetical protein
MSEGGLSDHDQRFKQLLETFWDDLLSIMAPQHAERLRGVVPEFLRQEYYTDLPQGERRNVDIVAKLAPRGEEEFVLVHVEVEGQYRSEFPERMWRYFMQLYLRHERPVLPLAIYLKGGPAGLQRSETALSFYGDEVSRFRFYSLGLSGTSAESFLERPEPLAMGLAALMRYEGGSPAQHKLACFKRLAAQPLTELRQVLLLDCVQAYLPLEGALREEFQDLLQREPQPEVRNMELSWSQKIRHEAQLEARQEGLEKLRGLFGRVVSLRGLALSPEQQESVAQCQDLSQLQAWTERALTATTTAEVFAPTENASR